MVTAQLIFFITSYEYNLLERRKKSMYGQISNWISLFDSDWSHSVSLVKWRHDLFGFSLQVDGRTKWEIGFKLTDYYLGGNATDCKTMNEFRLQAKIPKSTLCMHFSIHAQRESKTRNTSIYILCWTSARMENIGNLATTTFKRNSSGD
jgi:hypothetical protein